MTTSTFPDEQAYPPPRVVRLLHKLIVRLGVRNSVIAISLPLVALAMILAVLLRLLIDAPVSAADHFVAAAVTLVLAPPPIWLASNLIIRLDRSQRAHHYMATHDSLTELYNRREFFQRVVRAHERVRRSGASSWLMMIDLDNFKTINDEWGHLAGDRAIRHAADLCRAETRPVDVLGRYGGDELAVLIVGMDRDAALTIATRLHKRIGATAFSFEKGRSLRLTASIGLASIVPPHGTLEHALADADAALREAKRGGRDRVCVYGESLQPDAAAA